jgi:tRNA threonylcarbamoyladenosine biosynthesis protein TsaB
VIVLAIDTSGHHGGLALTRDGSLVEEVTLHAPDGFGHHLFGVIQSLLARHSLTPAKIDCYAAASGPGSFTGIRVALAAIKGFAEVAGRPGAAVSNLQALAVHGSTALRAPLIDARREEIYGGLYDAALDPLAPEQVGSIGSWLGNLPDGPIEFIASDFSPFRTVLEAARPDARFTTAPHSLAAAVASLARDQLLRQRPPDPAALDANYVRRSDAELNWKEA